MKYIFGNGSFWLYTFELKEIWGLKNVGIITFLGQEILDTANYVIKKNGVEHFWVTKILDHESFQMKYNSFQEIINAKKKIWCKKYLGIKDIFYKKYLGKKQDKCCLAKYHILGPSKANSI